MCTAAPLMEFSGDQEFQQFLQKNEEFARKIKSDVDAMQKRILEEFKFGHNDQLELVRAVLEIPQVTLSCNPCNVEDCFNQIQIGLHIYHGYLAHIAEVLPSYANEVTSLQLDVSNLSTNIKHQMVESGLPTVSYPQEETHVLPSLEGQKEVGSFIILDNFQGFLETTIRALRHCGS